MIKVLDLRDPDIMKCFLNTKEEQKIENTNIYLYLLSLDSFDDVTLNELYASDEMHYIVDKNDRPIMITDDIIAAFYIYSPNGKIKQLNTYNSNTELYVNYKFSLKASGEYSNVTMERSDMDKLTHRVINKQEK